MQKTEQRTSMKLGVLLAVVLVALACCFMQVPQAHASEAWNNNVTVNATANPYDATAGSHDYNQTIDVTMTFASALPSSIDASTAQAYLQAHTSIAGRMLNSAAYSRAIDNVAVSGNTITFMVEPTAPSGTTYFTAIYSGEFKVTADANANSDFASAMGSAPVETLINTGLGLTYSSSSNNSVTYQVTALPKCRAMNFVIFQIKNDDETATNVMTNGSCASGAGITAHSHMFYAQDAANYASKICTAANAATSNYVFTAGTDGYFTITGPNAQDVLATAYNGSYLNRAHESVGNTTETIITDPNDPRI